MNKNLLQKILVALFILVGLAVAAVAIRYSIFATTVALNLRLIFFAILFADAICFFVAAWGVAKNIKWLYPLTIALLVVNALGLIFDDIGFADIAATAINILLLILLIVNHRKIRN